MVDDALVILLAGGAGERLYPLTRDRAKPAVFFGGRDVLLYPLYHPAAALYTPAMLSVLEQDFARLPDLLGREVAPEPELPEVEALVATEPAVQLVLF